MKSIGKGTLVGIASLILFWLTTFLLFEIPGTPHYGARSAAAGVMRTNPSDADFERFLASGGAITVWDILVIPFFVGALLLLLARVVKLFRISVSGSFIAGGVFAFFQGIIAFADVMEHILAAVVLTLVLSIGDFLKRRKPVAA